MSERDKPTEEFLEASRQELLDQGFDEDFVDCAIEDMREGESVTLVNEQGQITRVDIDPSVTKS